MVSITEGADADALIRLANKIESGAEQVEAVYGQVRPALHSSAWQGADADQFAGEWNGPQRQRLQHVASALRSAATKLRRNAQEQIEASNSDGSGSSSGGRRGGSRHGSFDPTMPIRIPGLGWIFPSLLPLGPGRDGSILGLPGLSNLPHWLSFPGLPGFSPSILPLLGHGDTLHGAWDSITGSFNSHMTGTAGWTLGVGGLSAAASGLAFAGWSGGTKGSFDAGPLSASGGVNGMYGVQAKGGASASIGLNGLNAGADAHLFAGAQVGANGDASLGLAHVGVGGTAMAGVTADGSAKLHAGLDGFSAGASGNAFAGVSADGSVTAGISGGTVTASGGVEAGIGVGGEAKVSAGWHGTDIKLGGNVALGLGVKGSIDVHVDPSQIVSDTAHIAEGAYKGAENLLSQVPHPSWPF